MDVIIKGKVIGTFACCFFSYFLFSVMCILPKNKESQSFFQSQFYTSPFHKTVLFMTISDMTCFILFLYLLLMILYCIIKKMLNSADITWIFSRLLAISHAPTCK